MSIEEITALAEQYARKYNPDSVAPFPHAKVAEDQADLDIYFADLEDEDVSGTIFFKDGRFTILINSAKPETRQHFTLGHELGHYFLHQDVLKRESGIVDGDSWLDGANILYRMDGAQKTQMELEANNFAASLIMPDELVRRAWEVTHDIEECAGIFQVSTVAMSVRLTRLGLVD